jgi:hypothetical protein
MGLETAEMTAMIWLDDLSKVSLTKKCAVFECGLWLGGLVLALVVLVALSLSWCGGRDGAGGPPARHCHAQSAAVQAAMAYHGQGETQALCPFQTSLACTPQITHSVGAPVRPPRSASSCLLLIMPMALACVMHQRALSSPGGPTTPTHLSTKCGGNCGCVEWCDVMWWVGEKAHHQTYMYPALCLGPYSYRMSEGRPALRLSDISL